MYCKEMERKQGKVGQYILEHVCLFIIYINMYKSV